MVIVAMGWLYVVALYAAAQDSVGAALSVLLFLGLLPLALLGRVLRRRRRLARARVENRRET